VDHYDSFTHNLRHALEAAGAACHVLSHDAASVAELLAADGVVLSAGPCSPRETIVTMPFLEAVLRDGGPPVLGVCLGHQCIAQALGAKIVRARRAVHGRVVPVSHDARGLFAGLPSPTPFARYNSLAVEALAGEVEASAWDDDGQLMGLRHRTRALEGVQFHPESHLSVGGAVLFRNWVQSLLPTVGLRTPSE